MQQPKPLTIKRCKEIAARQQRAKDHDRELLDVRARRGPGGLPADEVTKTKRRLKPREIVSMLEMKLGERYGTKIPLRELKRGYYRTTAKELAKKFVSNCFICF